jgi:hypothetical protein
LEGVLGEGKLPEEEVLVELAYIDFKAHGVPAMLKP